MEEQDTPEECENTTPTIASTSWQAINLPIPQHTLSRTRLSMKAQQSGNNSNESKVENCSIDTNPGSSKQCGVHGNSSVGDNPFIAEQFLVDCNEENFNSVSLHSVESFLCRICHINENSEKLVAPCLCKGSLSYVHTYCLERWVKTSRYTICELCQYQYNTQQTLRYTFLQSLRVWYSRPSSLRILQEDCQLFSFITLVAFGIIGTILVAIQYYNLQGTNTEIARAWSKGWMMFFLFATLAVYMVNVYMIAKSHLTPWYRWWQSAREIHLILENHPPSLDNQTKGQLQQKNQHQPGQHHGSTVIQSSGETPMTGGTTTGQGSNDYHMTTTCVNYMMQSQDNKGNIVDKGTANTITHTTITTADADVFVGTAEPATLLVLPINSVPNCLDGLNIVAHDVKASTARECYNCAICGPVWKQRYQGNVYGYYNGIS
ncbi:uncharacterized protein LOC106081171 isoform X2 [Stomoxys calcitrans]|uniref:uncharacterized protein LOC106081171 isoform X2 n=2 Tax=Stomoxys calcitrans TaxID=35570 RepID=UPI0027E31992|nr:uncharacterized protein LOC106081171 isoform X2 [Stomoxys calcitrans]